MIFPPNRIKTHRIMPDETKWPVRLVLSLAIMIAPMGAVHAVDRDGAKDGRARPGAHVRPSEPSPSSSRAAKRHARKTQRAAAKPQGAAKGTAAKAPDGKGRAAAAAAVVGAGAVAAGKTAAKPVKPALEPSGKLPRYAALKTEETNMRVGPGQRYPIEWVYKRRDLPVEVEKEYDVWRYVRDPEGIRGWVHQVTLSERRTFVVKDNDVTIRSGAEDTASAVAVLKTGVIGRLRSCDSGSKWCQVQVNGLKGYLRRDQMWGLLPDEVVTPS